MSAVEFVFPRGTRCYRWVAESRTSGTLKRAGSFTKGTRVFVSAAIEQTLPRRGKVMAFEIWRDGAPCYFDPKAVRVSKTKTKSMIEQLRTYLPKTAVE